MCSSLQALAEALVRRRLATMQMARAALVVIGRTLPTPSLRAPTRLALVVAARLAQQHQALVLVTVLILFLILSHQ